MNLFIDIKTDRKLKYFLSVFMSIHSVVFIMQRKMCSTDMEQRNGRIERQGNENPEVDIYR